MNATIATETRWPGSLQRLVRGHGRTHLDLFSGIGGFALAARWNEIETIGFAEIEPYACNLIKRHWPGVPNFGDVRNVTGIRAWLVTGGFPCQPFSSAGKRTGKEDDRYLWPEMRRAIADVRPAWVLAENVPDLDGVALDDVLSDLESIGYEAAPPLEIPAAAVGAPHKRNRLWLVAYSASVGRERPAWQDWKPNSGSVGTCGMDAIRGGQNVADANGGRQQERAQLNGQKKQAAANGHPRRPHSDGCGNALADSHSEPMERTAIALEERNPWATEPAVGRVANGVSRRVDRLKGLGNAIVPQIAANLIRWMLESDETRMTPNVELSDRRANNP